jgi:tryptophanase
MLIDDLKMAFDDDLPFHELEQVEYIIEKLNKKGIPVIKPLGGSEYAWILGDFYPMYH